MAFVKRVDAVDESLRTLVAPMVGMIHTLTATIKDYERRIEAMETRYPEGRGFGP